MVLEDRFWIQIPDVTRRAGLLVLTEDRPLARRGDRVALSGLIEHFIPENRPADLGVTRMIQPRIEVISAGHGLPKPVQIGAGGVLPPEKLAPEALDQPLAPSENAIDFWTALIGMRVALPVTAVVGPTSRFQETWVIASEAHRNQGQFGQIAAEPGDFNPERILVQANPLLLPSFPDPAAVGDRLAPVTGIVDYRFGNFRIVAEHALRRIPRARPEIAGNLSGDRDHLLIASYNVENLNPWVEDFGRVRSARDVDDAIGSGRMATLAGHIVTLMNAPDIIGLQEIQDGNGAEDSDLVSAERTLSALSQAISTAGGPDYHWIDVPPERNADGGQPGGNIRNVFLYNPARVELIANSVERITGPAFSNSRKSLVARFEFNGQSVVVINNHFASKGGSDPLFGQRQPPVEGDAEQRQLQAKSVLEFAAGLPAQYRSRLVVLGDFNDHWFSKPLDILTSDMAVPLHNPVKNLPAEERFTYVFQGNAQAIDHILVSRALKDATQLELLPVNSLNARQAADHDPLVIRLFLPAPMR
jgi:endonuclease/exonuclease/phosphatase family metal-dependent hydrolase